MSVTAVVLESSPAVAIRTWELVRTKKGRSELEASSRLSAQHHHFFSITHHMNMNILVSSLKTSSCLKRNYILAEQSIETEDPASAPPIEEGMVNFDVMMMTTYSMSHPMMVMT
jgi:hypothetical protein